MQPIISFSLFLLLCGLPRYAASQQVFICRDVVSSSGGFAQSSGRHFEFSLGEPAVQSMGSGSIRLSQGFNQPEVCPLILVGDHEALQEKGWVLYPNPVFERLHLRLETSVFPEYQIQLFDAAGRLLRDVPSTVEQGEFSLDCSRLSSGVYFLILRTGDGRQFLSVPFVRQGL